MLQQLPSKPNLENLKKQAKSITKSHSKHNQQTCDILRHLNRFKKLSNKEILSSSLTLSEAQFALAISYGFKSWTALKKFVANTGNLVDKIKSDNKTKTRITKSEEHANRLNLFERIAKKNSDKAEIVKEIIKNTETLSFIFDGLENKKADIKYGCEKILMIISENDPAVLYPQFDFFVELLSHKSNFMKLGAIRILGNLTKVDKEYRFEKIFEKYFVPVPGPVLITAANIIGSAAKIALAKPELTEKIIIELLKVEIAEYQTTECRNIALGHFIVSVDLFFNQIKDKESVVELIKKQLNNTRNATKKKAVQFVKKYKL